MNDQVRELQAAQDQIEQLVRAIVEIGSDLDLHGTLHRIVKAAIELTGARVGALGVSAADGGFSSFIHEGIDAMSRSSSASWQWARDCVSTTWEIIRRR